jgi:maltooligosyltrehalose synthase
MFVWGKRKDANVSVQQAMGPVEQGNEDVEQEQSYQTDCAWCLAEVGADPGSGSHGICAYHSEQMMLLYQERKARR